MNKGSLQSPLVMAAGNPNWWNINNSMRAPLQVQQPLISSSSSSFLCPNNNSNHFLHHDLYKITPTTSSSSNVWHHDDLNHANSWSQLIMGGLEGHEEDNKKLEMNWESQVLHHHHPQDFEAVSNLTWCDPPILPLSSLSSPSPPKSYVTNGSTSTQIVDFSNKGGDGRHPPPDRSLECNSNFGGRAIKRARVQPSSSNQSTLKVRKEKLGDRITALHQLVSPFGKTDTASVLLEAIGYIRFLQTQIEALSLPYLGSTGSGNNRHQLSESNCIFPEDPGQVHGDEEAKQDLRSRGLCLVPVSSSTLQVGSSNEADYWAPSQLGR